MNSIKPLLSLFVLALMGACKEIDELKVDPCTVYPNLETCLAVPINQGNLPPYERAIEAGNICFKDHEYTNLKKYGQELQMRYERCQRKVTDLERLLR